MRRLQARHGLTVDGVVGPATWSVLGVQGAEELTPPPSALPKPEAKATAASANAAPAGEGEAAEAPAAEGGASAIGRLQYNAGVEKRHAVYQGCPEFHGRPVGELFERDAGLFDAGRTHGFLRIYTEGRVR